MREATAKPIVGVGRYTNPDTMAAVIRTGAIDLIGAARPAIADPFLPTKIREGRLDEIRECTGSNLCILREESFHHVGCLQNPTAGEEYRRGWHPELFEPPADPEPRSSWSAAAPRAWSARWSWAVAATTRCISSRPSRARRQDALDASAADAGRLGPVIDHRVIGLTGSTTSRSSPAGG